MIRSGLFALGLAVATFSVSSAEAKSTRVHGALILDKSVPTGDGRYRSTTTWDKTLKFYRSVYRGTKGVVWHRMNTNHKVKGVYLQNTRPGATWEAINIYQHKGRIFISVVPPGRLNKKSPS